MPAFKLPSTEGIQNLGDLIDYVAKIAKEISWVLNNLDRANINHLIFRFNNGAYIKIDREGIEISDGIHVTFKADMNGHVTMTSAHIQSALGYPKVELNSEQNLIAAYSDEDTYIAFTPLGNNNVPALSMVHQGQLVGFLNHFLNTATLGTFGGNNINFQPSGNLQMNGVNAKSGVFYVSSTPGGPANVQINFRKGILTEY